MDELREDLDGRIHELETEALRLDASLRQVERDIRKQGSSAGHELYEHAEDCRGRIDRLMQNLEVLYAQKEFEPEEELAPEIGYATPWELTVHNLLRKGARVGCLMEGEPEDDQQIFFVDDDVDGRRPQFSRFDIRPDQKLSGWGVGLKEAVNDLITDSIYTARRPRRVSA